MELASVRAVVRADQNIVLAGIRACPVIAAWRRPIPAGGLFFIRARRVLVRDGQADKVCGRFLAAPEAGVEIVAADGDRAVRLALERIMVDPERLQRFGVERLDRTVGKSDEHHAIGIGRRRDGKARRAIHFGLRQDLAGNRVDAADHIPRADDQNAVHQQRAAGRAAVYAAADRIRPVKRGRVGIHRHLDRYDGVVAACGAAGRAIGVIARSAEIGPFGGQAAAAFRSSAQR